MELVIDGVKSEARLTIDNIGIGNIITLATFLVFPSYVLSGNIM